MGCHFLFPNMFSEHLSAALATPPTDQLIHASVAWSSRTHPNFTAGGCNSLFISCYTSVLFTHNASPSTARRTSDQLAYVIVGGFSEEPQQSRNTATVPQRHLVVVAGFAVDQVPQGPAGTLLDLGHFVVQLVHQVLDPTQVAHLRTSRTVPDPTPEDTDWLSANSNSLTPETSRKRPVICVIEYLWTFVSLIFNWSSGLDKL